jgi:hypothetical protein
MIGWDGLELQLYFMRSLHGMREMNAYRADRVRLPVRMFQLENRWTNFDQIWYGNYATGG